MPDVSLPAAVQGFGLGASLIIAIGAQNAFVLRQGLKRQHVFATAAICTLCDFALIGLGVGGIGALISRVPVLNGLALWGGALFLLVYGFRSLRAALRPEALRVANDAMPAIPVTRLRQTILTALAFSLLNPHVYLDTVVLLGSVGGQYPLAERPWFAAGAMLASLAWFFGLAYGAAWLAPLFQRPLAWRVLDVIIAVVMWAIAASLLWAVLHQS